MFARRTLLGINAKQPGKGVDVAKDARESEASEVRGGGAGTEVDPLHTAGLQHTQHNRRAPRLGEERKSGRMSLSRCGLVGCEGDGSVLVTLK